MQLILRTSLSRPLPQRNSWSLRCVVALRNSIPGSRDNPVSSLTPSRQGTRTMFGSGLWSPQTTSRKIAITRAVNIPPEPWRTRQFYNGNLRPQRERMEDGGGGGGCVIKVSLAPFPADGELADLTWRRRQWRGKAERKWQTRVVSPSDTCWSLGMCQDASMRVSPFDRRPECVCLCGTASRLKYLRIMEEGVNDLRRWQGRRGEH